MPRRRLVLASGSSARLRLLRDAGFDPEVIPSGVDESGVDAPDTAGLAQLLAERKASAVLDAAGEAVVVGCDSLLELDGRRYGKPADATEALAWLSARRGAEGTLWTGHAVIDGRSGGRALGVAETLVRFGHPTDEELRAYVATGEPLAAAGAFTIDGRGAPFMAGVVGDPGNVVGLSLPLLRQLLSQLGLTVMDLWA